MVSTTVIEIILQAKDKASEVAKKAEDALKKAGDSASESFKKGTSATEAMENALRKVGTTARNLPNNIRGVFTAINNAMSSARTKIQNLINDFGRLSPRFKTVAESIKHNIDSAMEHVKSKIKSVTSTDTFKSLSNSANNSFNKIKSTATSTFNKIKNEVKVLSLLKPSILIKGNTEPFEKSRMHVYAALQELSRMNIDIPFGNIDSAAEHIGKINVAFDKVHTGATKVAQTVTSVTQRISTGFSGLKSKISGFTQSLGQTGAALKTLSEHTGTLGQGFTLLKGALANVIGMIGYDLVNNIVQSTRATINARGNIETFAKRLNMSTTELKSFNNQINKMQQEFRKVDMQQVGASALELANKLDVPKNKLGDLTKTIAVMSSAFIREGRTSEDAILGVSDALDGQFKRLQEIGITQDTLMANGWNGNIEDTASLIDALNKSMDELGITETAQQVTNLDDAWQVLNISLSHLLTEIIVPLTPILVGLISTLADAANAVTSWWASMPDGAKIAVITAALTALGLVIGTYVISSIMALQAEIAALEIELLPIIATLLAIAAVVAVLVLAFYECGKAMGWWTDGASALKVIGDALRNVFNTIANCLTTIYNGFMEVASPFITEFWNYLLQVLEPLKGSFMLLWDSLVKLGDAFGGASGSGSLFATIGRLLAYTILPPIITGLKLLIAILVPVIEFVVNTISNLIDYISLIKRAWDDLMNGNISFLDFLMKVFGGALTFLTSIGGNIVDMMFSICENILSTIGVSLGDISKTVSEWLAGLGNNIGLFFANILVWFYDLVVNFTEGLGGLLLSFSDWGLQVLEWLLNLGVTILTNIINWLIMLPITVLEYLMLFLQSIWNWGSQLVTQAVEIGSQFLYNLLSWFARIPIAIWNILVEVIGNVLGWDSQMKANAKQAGQNFIMNVVTYISQLPSKIWNWLQQTITNVINWGVSIVKNAKESALKLVTGFTDKIKELPKKMTEELDHIRDNIVNYASKLWQAAKDLAWNAIQGFISGLDSHSPGIMARTMGQESQYIQEAMEEHMDALNTTATNMADTIVNGFGNPQLNAPNVNGVDSTQTVTSQPIIDPTQNQQVTEMMMQQNALLTENIGTNTAQINMNLLSTVNALTKLANSSTNSTSTVDANNKNVTNSYNQMMTLVNNMLNNIIQRNITGWQNVKTTTETNLKSILNSTKSVTQQMVDAWNTMKNSIVKAADSIKTESTNRFNTLWNTIKTFYHNIQHPGGAGAPSSGTARNIRRSGAGFGNISNALRTGISQVVKPSKKRLTGMDLSSIGFSTQEVGYMIPTGNTETVATTDVLRYVDEYGAGWDSTVKPNTQYIRDKSNQWSVAGPVILGKYPTGLDIFKVKDFENGTPTISYDTFRRMAEAVFNQCHYEFYWDSERYGSWQAAAYNGGMNCSDSTDFLIAMAHACGLSASKVHGHWNQYGHYWANVAGHKMDTTGWMQHKNWTPSQSHAGPSPEPKDNDIEFKTQVIQLLSEIIKLLVPSETEPVRVVHEGSVQYDFTHDIQGELPDGISKEDVEAIMNAHAEDSNFLKRIANNREFQERFERMQYKLLRERERFS